MATNIPEFIPNISEPKWLNLEYIYAKIFQFLANLPDLILYLIYLLAQYFFRLVFLFISAIFAVLLAIVIVKFYRLKRRKKIKSYIKFAEEEALLKARSDRWGKIKKKIDSEETKDWKEAIVLADSILDDIFKGMGFKAEGLGEKLKSVEPSDFLSMRDVWEAHKVRLKMTREGDDFKLAKTEAESVLKKYEKGLKELGYL